MRGMFYKIKNIYVFLFAFTLMLVSASTVMALNVISDIRTGQQVDGIRLVVEGNEKFDYDAFLLDNPNRLVIDLKNATIKNKPNVKANRLVDNFRVGDLANVKGKRLVFSLKSNANIKKKFILEPQKGQSNWRLVIDLNSEGGSVAIKNNKSSSNANRSIMNRKKIVVLDPGHGGRDPGAIGRSFKTYEKNITLSMSKELKKVLENKGFKVYLTRSTDIFIPLRKRVAIARSHHADLFISVHADSTINRKAQGFSIYTLSETASDKEAEALAERENKADIIDGMDFSDNSPEINDVLISLSQNDSRNKSSKFASYVVSEMRSKVKLVNNTHKFAGFAVLKAPDVPSVLLELGYLSNYTEEKYLRNPSYRKKIADAMGKAVSRYFKDPEVASSF